MNDKTHFRKAFNSPYLSSADIVEPITLTVRSSSLEGDKSKKTKEQFNTLYFVENEIRKGESLKPMVLNATNSKMMKSITGSPFLDDWGGVRVTVYVQQGIRFGRDTVDGLRLMAAAELKFIEPDTSAWNNAVSAYKRDKNFDAVEKRYKITDENKELIKELAA